MARLWQCGFELNSNTADVEFTSQASTNITLQSTVVKSGTYAGQKPAATSSGVGVTYKYSSSNFTAPIYYRMYFRVATFSSARTFYLIRAVDAPFSNVLISIRLVSGTNTLELWNEEDAAQVGSSSSALSANVWYRLELKIDTTTLANTSLDARLDGVSFASGTVNLANGTGNAQLAFLNAGAAESVLNGYFDDMAINDSSGSFQNSYPGEGKIIHLRPNAAGDNTGWTGDYTDIDEVTPDDNTTKLSSNTLDQIEDVNIDFPTAISNQDTINVVAIGCRFNGAGASANASFVLRIKASASGTVEESSAITPSNTTWVTNAAAAPRNYSLTLYDLPGASTTAWTKNDLENAQIGVRLSATSTNAAQVSTLWMSVDYTPVFGSHKAKPKNPKINYNI